MQAELSSSSGTPCSLMVHILRIKIGAVLSFHSGTVVRVWNCTPAKHGNKRKGKPKGSGKERAENERKRALAMASQIPTHCTMSSYPLFFCGNENMYNMLHAPVYGRTGSFGVSKRRATCPSLYPRKFLLRYRAAGKWSCAAVRSLLCFSFRGG